MSASMLACESRVAILPSAWGEAGGEEMISCLSHVRVETRAFCHLMLQPAVAGSRRKFRAESEISFGVRPRARDVARLSEISADL